MGRPGNGTPWVSPLVVLAALVVLGVLASCGGAQDVRELHPEHAPDLSLVSAAAAGADYEEAESPGDLIQMWGTRPIVAGAVEAVEKGRGIYSAPEDPVRGATGRDTGSGQRDLAFRWTRSD